MISKTGKDIYQPNKQRNILNKKFGKLTPVCFVYRDSGHQHYWKFECDCGNEIIARKSSVTSGNTTQCKKCSLEARRNKIKTHGKSRTRLYKEWAGIIQRCENPRSTSYDRYGNMGISVCDEWHVFENFMAWALDSGYSDKLTIDRIDYQGNYEPSNCRWVSVLEQNNNTKTNIRFLYNGENHTLAEWARIYGMKYSCLYARWRKNTDPEYLFKGYLLQKEVE